METGTEVMAREKDAWRAISAMHRGNQRQKEASDKQFSSSNITLRQQKQEFQQGL